MSESTTPSMPELLADLTQENQRLRKRVERLIGALTEVGGDMHNTSTRPCGTCSHVTAILGEEFGCLAWQRKHKQ